MNAAGEWMMKELDFFVPGIPQTAGSKRVFLNKKTGKPIVTDDCKRGKDWRATVQHFALAATINKTLLEGAIQCDMSFVLLRPKGHYGTGKRKRTLKPSAPMHPTKRPDRGKLARAVEDALTGVIWRDDAQVVCGDIVKRYGEQPGVHISIKELIK